VSKQERAVTIIFPRLGQQPATGRYRLYRAIRYADVRWLYTFQFGTRALVNYAGFFTALRRQFGGQQAGTAPMCPAVAVARVTDLVVGQDGSDDRDLRHRRCRWPADRRS
jgi:hypothetical protein